MKKLLNFPAKRTLAFTLVIILLLSLLPILPLTVNAEEAGYVNWEPEPGYHFVKGNFSTADSDFVYDGNQPYDWVFTVTQSKGEYDIKVVTTITDASGKALVKKHSKVVTSPIGTATMCSSSDFKDALPITLEGTFTFVCKLYNPENNKLYCTMTAVFQRKSNQSISVAITSRSNPDLVFTVADPIDLVLNIKKTDSVPERFNAAVKITGSSGNELLTARGVPLPVSTNISLILKDTVNIATVRNPGKYYVDLILTNQAGTICYHKNFSFSVTELEEAFTSDLSVGFGRVDVSPTESVPLRGYGYSSGRMSTKIQDPLYATCIALSDSNDNTVLIFTVDLTNAYTEVVDDARLQISQATGIPVDAIMVSCTHTHSAPDLLNLNEPSIPRYIKAFPGWLVEAAVAALEDRAPTRVYTTSVETENLNFVRRYVQVNGVKRHETEVDNVLQLIRLQRSDKKDIIMANFQTHPHRVGSTTAVTADLIAPFRTMMEDTLDCHFAYFTGSSGNVNPTSSITSENVTGNYTEQGQALAEYALAAYNSFQEVPVSEVKIEKAVYKGKVDHTFDNVADKCKEAVDYYLKYGNYDPYTYLGNSGVRSIYHANAIAIRGSMPKVQDINLYAISLGDLAFVTVPFEMFDTNGMQIKEGSPFSMTFVLTCANNNFNYLPSEIGWQNGGYEVDATLFQRGTAEDLVASYLALLNTLYQKS